MNLEKYIKTLEFDIKNSFALNEFSLSSKSSDEIIPYLKNILGIVFESSNKNFKNKDEIIAYAIDLAEKYLKEENIKKEILLSINLAFLVYFEFDKEIRKNLFQELDLYGNSFFLLFLPEFYKNNEQYKDIIEYLKLSFLKVPINEIYKKCEEYEKNILNILENLTKVIIDEEEIEFEGKQDFEKKVSDLDDFFYIL